MIYYRLSAEIHCALKHWWFYRHVGVSTVQKAVDWSGVHSGALPRVAVVSRVGDLSNTAYWCLNRLHNTRHHPRTLSVRRQLGFLQQLGQGKCAHHETDAICRWTDDMQRWYELL